MKKLSALIDKKWITNRSINFRDHMESFFETFKTLQHFTCVLIRAVLCVLSVNLPFMFIADKPINSTLYMNRDYISRLIYGISVCLCQPLIYFALLATFREDVNLVFKRYSHNTKRQWVSAGEMLITSEYKDFKLIMCFRLFCRKLADMFVLSVYEISITGLIVR